MTLFNYSLIGRQVLSGSFHLGPRRSVIDKKVMTDDSVDSPSLPISFVTQKRPREEDKRIIIDEGQVAPYIIYAPPPPVLGKGPNWHRLFVMLRDYGESPRHALSQHISLSSESVEISLDAGRGARFYPFTRYVKTQGVSLDINYNTRTRIGTAARKWFLLLNNVLMGLFPDEVLLVRFPNCLLLDTVVETQSHGAGVSQQQRRDEELATLAGNPPDIQNHVVPRRRTLRQK